MTKNETNVGDTVKSVYDLLVEHSSENRSRILSAVQALLGGPVIISNSAPTASNAATSTSSNSTATHIGTAVEYFDVKKPSNKGEELATAARFREDKNLGEMHSKDELHQIFKEARRVFDSHNFKRDIDNAIRKSGLFLPSQEKGTHQLSAFGQKYIDTLPNRESLKDLKKVSRSRKKKTSKKTSSK